MSNTLVKMVQLFLILFFVSLIGMALFLPEKTVSAALDKERDLIVSSFGTDSAVQIISDSDRWYKAIFVDSGAIAFTFNLFIPSKEQVKKSTNIETMGANFFELLKERFYACFSVLYAFTQRMYLIAMWFPLCIPFLAAAIYDGLQVRKIKMLSFQSLSAPIFGAMQHAFVFLLFIPIVYLFLPFPVTPLLMPTCLIVVGLVAIKMFSNLQRL